MVLRTRPRLVGGLAAACLVFLAACGGGGGGSSSGGGDGASPTKNAVAAPTGAVASKLQPQLNGWAFPNFPSATFPELNFDTSDLVSMFGSGPDVCVDGVVEPCTLTAEAAAWARMVNQARATGHCEGLVVLASARYNRSELPETVKLPSDEDEIRAVMRAFATQFVPEVQKSIEGWTKASLADKVDELKRSFSTDKLQYTLGVYVEGGGHAVLPYAVEYPTPDVARIMVYDSNWPGRNRYVDVDLANDKWSFSFAGDDPANDPNIWSGGAVDMDLTPFEAREGTCPFCGDGTKLQSTTLLVRTENLDWSVETGNGAVSPTTPVSGDGSTARPVKGGVSIVRMAAPGGGRSSFDYLITIPNNLLDGGESSTTTSGVGAVPVKKRAKLKFGGASSVFAVMKTGVAQFTTPGGGDDKPVELGTDSIKSNDPNVDLTLASGNLVANASGPSVELGSSGGTLDVAVTTATGEIIEQQVTPEAPAVQVKADETGGVTVLEASASGEVKKTEVAADGTKTETVVDASELNLNKVEVELPPALESKAIEALPKLEDRNLNNPNYKADEAYVPPTTVPAPKENATGPTTSIRTETASTVQTRNAALPTTTVARSVTAAGATPTTIAAVVRPTLANFRIASKTFGDDAFTLDPPDSNSPGGFRYSSSKTDVATVNATTGRVTIVGAGTATITATQAAVRGFEAGTISATLIVTKAKPTIAETRDIIKTFGDDPFAVKDPVSNSTGAITYASSNEDVLKQSRTTGRWVIAGAGRATITVSQASTDDYLSATDTFVVTVRKGTPEFKAPADIAKTFLDADFDLPKPTSTSKGAFTFSSSDAEVLSITATGRATIKSNGTVTVTASQAATDDWLAASVTYKVVVAAATAELTGFDDISKTFGDDAFTVAKPKSGATGSFTFSSSDEKVIKIGESDGKVTIIGAGTATVTVKQAASKGYAEATISRKITIGKATPKMSDLLVADKEFGDGDFTLKPTSNSSGKITFSTDKTDVFKVDEATGSVRIVGVGSATLTAKQASTANYEATSVSATVTVKKGTPALTWSPGTKTFGDADFDLTPPTSPSSGKFTFSVANDDASRARVLSSGKLTLLRAGTVSLTAKQEATALWNEASVTATLTVDKAAPTITNFVIPAKTYGDAQFTIAAPTSDSPSPFTYELVAGTSDVVTLSGLRGQDVTVGQAGSVQVRVRQVASDNFTAGSATTTLTVNKKSQSAGVQTPFGFTPTSVTTATPTMLTLVGGAGTGEVTYTVVTAGTTSCVVSPGQTPGTWSLNATSTGTCTVMVAKADDRNHLAIESEPIAVTVSSAQLVNPSPSSPTSFDLLGDFVAGPNSQVSSNFWQYLEVPSARSSATLLPNWQTSGNEIVQNESQWDNNRTNGNYPFVQLVSNPAVTASGSTAFGGNAAVLIHPDNSDSGVGVAWQNNSGSDRLVDLAGTLKLAYPNNNTDGISYHVQRGLVGGTNYSLLMSGTIANGTVSATVISQQGVLVPAGESIYVVVGRNGIYYWDHTILTLNVTNAASQGVVSNGLISHLNAASISSYPGSGTTWFDISGNGNNATLSSVTHDPAGFMVFPGSGHANWGTPLPTGSSYTIEGWIWRNTNNGENIVSTFDAPFWFSNGTTLSAGVGGGYGGSYYVVNATTLATQVWMHVAVTFDDASNTMRLYRDGLKVAESTTATQQFISQVLMIGAHNDADGGNPRWQFFGKMSEMRLYDRALNGPEITQNYSATAPHCTSATCQNLALWMDPSDTSTWTASNGAITSVADKSGLGRGLSQSDPSRQPGLSSSTRNGLNYFEFASTTNLRTASLTLAQPLTVFAVVRNASAQTTNRQIIGNAVTPNPSPALYVSGGVWRQASPTEHLSQTSVDQSWHYLSAVYNGASSKLYLDGTLILDSSANANPGTNSWNASPIVIGSRGTNEFGWIGDIAEVMMFSGSMSVDDRVHTEKYLARKWGFSQ